METEAVQGHVVRIAAGSVERIGRKRVFYLGVEPQVRKIDLQAVSELRPPQHLDRRA